MEELEISVKIEKIFIILFFSLLVIPFLYSLFFSELLEIPKFSCDEFFSGNYQKKMEDWFRQKLATFYPFTSVKIGIDVLTKKVFANDVYAENSNLLKIPKLPDKKAIKYACNSINSFSKNVCRPVYFLLIPTKVQVSSSNLVAHYFKDKEFEVGEEIRNCLNETITKLDESVILTYSKDFNFFYRTDEIINSLGAFLLYSQNMKQLGAIPVIFQKFNIEHLSENFYGKLFNKMFFSMVEPDVVEFFHSSDFEVKASVKEIFSDIKKIERKTLQDVEMLNGKNKAYSLFGYPAPIKEVITNSNNKESLLVFADENFDSFAQFLSLHYRKITVINLAELAVAEFDEIKNSVYSINCGEYDRVLIISSIECFSNEAFFNIFNMLRRS